jgi:hypothetical protein
MTALLQHTTGDIRELYARTLDRHQHAGGNHLVLVSHFGEFNQSKIDQLIRIVESSVLEQGDKRQAMKRVYGAMVEVMQNMAIHSTRDQQNRMYGYIILTRTPEHYLIEAGNLILQVSSESLKQRLDALNAMDKNQIRRAYVDTLCNEDFTDKGGAGLGMLTVAKRASQPIGYTITRLENPFAYLSLSISLDIIE